MGVVLPVIMIAGAAVASTAAVYTAVTLATVATIAFAAVSVAATVASIVYAVQGNMQNAMLFAGLGIAGGVGTVYVGAMQATAQASALMAQGMAEATAAAAYMESNFAMQAMGWVSAIQSSFSSFLQAIHFKLILSAHQIAYLVSGEYRNMMTQVFFQINQVSSALRMGDETLNLILRDARNIVLDTSAMMGHSFDVGELTYWATAQSFFQEMSTKMDTYKRNPGQLFFDLDQKIFKPSVDAKAETQRMVYSTIDNIVRVTETTTNDIVKVGHDLKSFASHLPEEIRSQIEPAIKVVVGQIDTFVKSTYNPAMDGLKIYMTNLKVDHDSTALRLSDLLERSRKPSSLFAPMEELDLDEMFAEEEYLASKTGRSLIRQLESFEDAARPDREETSQILAAIPEEEEIIPEAFFGGEVPEIGSFPPVIPRDKWEVGDY
jgi:hypothetical protein